MQQLVPQLFADVDISTSRLPCFTELRHHHEKLLEARNRVEGDYKVWDALGTYYDYDKDGEGHHRFHPTGLPRKHTCLPVAAMGSVNEYNEHAQRRYSQIIHHAAWLEVQQALQAVSVREGVRFVAVSQPFAGAFLNAVPRYAPFRLPSPLLRIALQRRLGLPLLSAVSAVGRCSAGGTPQDCFGDTALALARRGHGTRHNLVRDAIFDAMRRVWGTQARYEPKDYHDYSDHRPDLTLMADELTVYDLKVFDPLGSDSAAFSIRGSHVAFGNTLPGAREKVLGRRERGAANGKAFCPTTGEGYAAEVHGDYARTRRLGITVTLLLVEAFGGLGADLVQLLERASAIREERLEAAEYDEATWSTRKFIPFVTQRISVALQRGVANEILESLNMGPVEGHDLGC